ncbi:MAG: rhombosortase [Woeseiaceae bacterium]|nr:rhombosortase [Woeseiaceae bacterium]
MGLHEADIRARQRQSWLLAGVVTVLCMLLEAAGVRDALAYDRAALAAGQMWRLLTGHFVHLGWTHSVLNLAGLALVVWLVGTVFTWLRWLYIGFVSIAAIDAGLWLFNTDLDWYVGLSGMLHGLLAAGLLPRLLQRDRESMVLAVFVLAKLVWEQVGGPLPGSESTSGGTVIVDAHLYGVIGGLLAGALLRHREPQSASI